MRRRTSVIVCLGAMALSAFLAAGASAQPKLQISAVERDWDLAVEYPAGLPVGRTAEHEFVLLNAGTEAVVIAKATTEQPFLTVEAPEGAIKPGETVTIKVTLNTEGLDPTLFEAYIVVEWNNPAPSPKPLVLTVKGRLIPKPETLLMVTPREQNVGVVRVGQTRTLTYKYENAGTTDFDINGLYLRDKRLTESKDIVKGPCPKAAPGEFMLVFTPQSEDAGKEIDALFVVSTNAPDQKRVICRVRGYVAPAEKRPDGVQVIPQFVPSKTGDDGTVSPPNANFHVVNNTDRTVEVVISRAGAELKRFTLRSQGDSYYEGKVKSADEFKEFAFLVTPYVVEPEPETPEAGAAEGEAVEGGSGEGEPGDEGETPVNSGEGETTEPADVEN